MWPGDAGEDTAAFPLTIAREILSRRHLSSWASPVTTARLAPSSDSKAEVEVCWLHSYPVPQVEINHERDKLPWIHVEITATAAYRDHGYRPILL